ncbi:MAG: HDOD domain-containing protein [Bdellovibrionales bacterium]|nr:HDOD domain-containing protein [Bdellovibrionales bacterium]
MQLVNSVDVNQGLSTRRLERIKNHVYKHWIPVNEELAAKILEGIDEGIYELDIDFLIADLRNDIGLFLYCARELASLTAARNKFKPSVNNPFEIIRRSGLNEIYEVLSHCIMNESLHSFESSSNIQTDRISEMLVAASAVEVMSENTDLNKEQGFSISLLRQLGMALIAWNYPGLYERAMNSIHEGKDPEEMITLELGTSPAMLSVKVIDDWGLDQGVKDTILPNNSEDVSIKMLKSLCEAGEALARSNDPKHYPKAREDWDYAREFVQELIGNDAIHLIRKKIRENGKHLFSLLPDNFQQTSEFNPDAIIHNEEEQKKIFRNPYLKDCPFVLRSKLKDLYSRIHNGEINRKNVAFLVNQVIPAAGFSGGIIYIINPSAMKLMPQMTFGDLFLTAPKPIRVGEDVMLNHPVQLAFNSWEITEGNVASAEVRTHTYMAGTIGSRKKAGVLYLEIDCKSENGITSKNYKLYFNAIMSALNDVLKLH